MVGRSSATAGDELQAAAKNLTAAGYRVNARHLPGHVAPPALSRLAWHVHLCEQYGDRVKHVTAGVNPVCLQRGILVAAAAVVADLRRRARPVLTHEEIAQVATVSANGDRVLGAMVASAFDQVGREGAVTVEEARGMETTLVVTEGLQFQRGYCSSYFVTDAERREGY